MSTSGFFDFDECEVRTHFGRDTLPAGRHVVLDQPGLGVSIRPLGKTFDIPAEEWQRLVKEQKVREV
jgi:hypothetical protein